MGSEVFVNKVEVARVADEIGSPNWFYCFYEGVVNFYFVFVEQIVSLWTDVKHVFSPVLLKFTEFGHLSHAFVKKMLDLAVDIDI